MVETVSKPRVPDHVPPELVVDFDAASDAGLRFDVFERTDQLRNASPPIAYSPYGGGHWMFFRERDIQQAFSDPEHFSTALFGADFNQGAPDMIPLCLDPPEHLPWRMVVARQLTPARMRALEPFIRQKAEALIAPLATQPRCDFLKAVAEPMPISIFMHLMGLPPEGFEEFRTLALQIVSPEGQDRRTQATVDANIRIIAILTELIEERRREPRNDLVTALIGETVKTVPIGARELLAICYVLFLGGLDTVVNAMTFGMRFLAMDQDLQQTIRDHPEQIPDLVETLLRKSAFVNPLRLVCKDVEIDGVLLKAGDIVWNMCWAGSNTPDGETTGPRHLAFGGGHHLCAGMHLARLELRVMYETWFRHVGRFVQAPDDGPTMAGGSVMSIRRLLLDLQPA